MKCIKKNAVHRGQSICKGAKMDERNNFDDIILDKSNKSERVKKLLLRIIALAILFLVVLIVMKLLSDSEPQQNALAPLPSEPAGTENEFENIPITSQNATEFDEFELFKLRMQGLDENDSAENNQSFVMPLPSSEYNNTIAPVPSEPTTKPKPAEPAKPATTKPADKPKAETKKPTTAPQKPAQKPATPSTNADKLSAGTYIQIFSVSNFDPKSKELALIEQNGYAYKLYKTKVDGKDITRVLVGPFSKDEVGAELKKVQDKIRKDAFTYQIK